MRDKKYQVAIFFKICIFILGSSCASKFNLSKNISFPYSSNDNFDFCLDLLFKNPSRISQYDHQDSLIKSYLTYKNIFGLDSVVYYDVRTEQSKSHRNFLVANKNYSKTHDFVMLHDAFLKESSFTELWFDNSGNIKKTCFSSEEDEVCADVEFTSNGNGHIKRTNGKDYINEDYYFSHSGSLESVEVKSEQMYYNLEYDTLGRLSSILKCKNSICDSFIFLYDENNLSKVLFTEDKINYQLCCLIKEGQVILKMLKEDECVYTFIVESEMPTSQFNFFHTPR